MINLKPETFQRKGNVGGIGSILPIRPGILDQKDVWQASLRERNQHLVFALVLWSRSRKGVFSDEGPLEMSNETVSFTEMKNGTREDYELLERLEKPYLALTADRILAELERHGESTLEGYRITRLEHGLQSATRALRDGADTDWVVGALLHDIGDSLAPQNHDRFSAEVMRPFVRWEVSWVVEHHGIFQMLYYGHHYGWDRNARDRFKDHPCFNVCADFCERWDQASFDPEYASEPLDRFEPLVREVFGRKAYDVAVVREGEVTGLPPLA